MKPANQAEKKELTLWRRGAENAASDESNTVIVEGAERVGRLATLADGYVALNNRAVLSGEKFGK